MPYISINLRDVSTEFFTPSMVISVLKLKIPSLVVDSEDAYSDEIRRVRSFLTIADDVKAYIIPKLERDAKVQGPAISFHFTLDSQRIRGIVKRRMLDMYYEEPVSDACVAEICSILKTVHPLGEALPIEVLNTKGSADH